MDDTGSVLGFSSSGARRHFGSRFEPPTESGVAENQGLLYRLSRASAKLSWNRQVLLNGLRVLEEMKADEVLQDWIEQASPGVCGGPDHYGLKPPSVPDS